MNGILLSQIKQAFLIGAGVSILVWTCAYIARILLPVVHGGQGFPWFADTNFFATVLSTWDTEFYSAIGQSGYVNTEDRVGKQDHLYAFFPLAPLILGGAVAIFGGVGTVLLSVIVVSSIVFAVGLIGKRWGSESVTLLLLAVLAPFGFFLAVPYTEGVYMVALLCGVYWLLNNKLDYKTYLPLIICGLALGLTRSTSIFWAIGLAVATVYFMVQKQSLPIVWKKLIAYCGSIFAGVAGVFVFNQIATGRWNTVLEVQKYWGRDITGGNFLDVIWRSIQDTLAGNISFTLIFIFGCIAPLCIWLLRIQPINAEWKYLTIASVVGLALVLYSSIDQNTLQSSNRYIFSTPLLTLLLPIVMVKNTRITIAYLLIGLLSLIICSAMFYRHYWVG